MVILFVTTRFFGSVWVEFNVLLLLKISIHLKLITMRKQRLFTCCT